MLPAVQALIKHYGLTPLPVEGTLHAGTWRAPAGRASASAMVGLYCDEPLSLSRFHRLSVDEVWHFYGGDALRLVLLHADGRSEDIILGPDPLAGQRVQFIVPAHTWQAGHMVAGGRYALFGCTLAPGFSPELFEGGARDVLLARYPGRRGDILALACEPGHTRMPV